MATAEQNRRGMASSPQGRHAVRSILSKEMMVMEEFQNFASFSAKFVATFSSTSGSWQPGICES